jgi:hypothetical protein
MNKELPSPEMLHTLLRYEPETGKLFWRGRPQHMFATVRACKIWNTRFAGKEAFTAIDSNGYRIGAVQYITLRAHRVIWAMETGDWPEGDVDHLDGDKIHNRMHNLRDVSRSINSRNARKSRRNTSGHNGVSWDALAGKWNAKIHLRGQQNHLGYFNCITAAITARKIAEIGHGFTERHGQ